MRVWEILRQQALLAKNAYKRHGIWYVVRKGLTYVPVDTLAGYYHIYLRLRTSFTFQGETCKYFYHRYNTTWKNERAVEVPVIRAVMEKHRGKRTLEVGNVLSHYSPIEHDVLDKYEKGSGIISEDICIFKPSEKYDLVVSISTLEHVGWDEEPKESEKILAALENLSRNVIAPGGKMVITLPLGYNTAMDELLLENKIRFSNTGYLKRISLRSNKWREAQWDELQGEGFRYQHRGYGASAVIIACNEY